MNIDTFLPLLSGVVRDGEGHLALCPGHNDHEPSLAVSTGSDGRILITCRAGCPADKIVSKLGLAMRDLFPAPGAKQIVAVYPYHDEAGTLLYESVRYSPKDFKQRRPDGKGGCTWKMGNVRRVLFGLPELLAADPSQPVFVVEGEKDVLSLRAVGALATCNPGGAGKWRDEYSPVLAGRRVIVVADRDEPGLAHARTVADALVGVAASVTLIDTLPSGKDATDYLTDRKYPGRGLDTLLHVAELSGPHQIPSVAPPPVPCTLAEAHAVVRRWLGAEYDIAAFDAMLATLAAERLNGDPVWTMFVGGPGDSKTETVISAAGAGALITSTIASEGALLSATAKRERSKQATGGLLRRIGDRGALVVKDFTSILSMSREQRATVLAAMREVYDGRWERNVGSDGGATLTWTGRIAVIGAVTTAWDTAHSVIAAMGDRFVVVRLDSTHGRETKGQQALLNTGHEVQMRAELVEAVARVIAGMAADTFHLTDAESQRLLRAADLVTRGRTACEYDFRGDVIEAHMPEAPTRFVKQLLQIVRGAVSIGVERDEAMYLAIRCARDSMPPLRLAILEEIAEAGGSQIDSTNELKRRLDMPWTTIKRQLQSLHLLGLLTVQETESGAEEPDAKTRRRFDYSLGPGVDPGVLALSPEKSVYGGTGGIRERARIARDQPRGATANSGERGAAVDLPF